MRQPGDPQIGSRIFQTPFRRQGQGDAYGRCVIQMPFKGLKPGQYGVGDELGVGALERTSDVPQIEIHQELVMHAPEQLEVLALQRAQGLDAVEQHRSAFALDGHVQQGPDLPAEQFAQGERIDQRLGFAGLEGLENEKRIAPPTRILRADQPAQQPVAAARPVTEKAQRQSVEQLAPVFAMLQGGQRPLQPAIELADVVACTLQADEVRARGHLAEAADHWPKPCFKVRRLTALDLLWR
ncbi:hypothetical protein D3C75_796110 [compost metagenome]